MNQHVAYARNTESGCKKEKNLQKAAQRHPGRKLQKDSARALIGQKPIFYLTNKEVSTVLCSVLQQNRAQSRLLCLFYDKESRFPHAFAEFSNQTLFSKGVKVASVVY